MNAQSRLAIHKGLRKHSLALATGLSIAFGASMAQAATWDVTVTNLTHGNHFTPLLLTAHDSSTHLFQVGMPAPLPIEHMAECGHLDPLLATAEVGAADADTIADPAGGVLAPGASTSAMLTTSATHLSVVAMVLPTNDGFLGLEAQEIPTTAGTYTYYINAYDAGTEANDEVLMTSGACSYTDSGMMPGAPGGDAGSNGTGVSSADTNTNIHVHRGVLGDQDPTGGNSDLDSTIHRWQNPVAKITVTVTP
ncbi:MAG TPA: hypothetical protein ENI97_06000 [Gammaproteobacteria bacterium]|nr:hypothetical protein [Gammaproteobacteria bacterium]